jgi:uncharacterized membrane protein
MNVRPGIKVESTGARRLLELASIAGIVFLGYLLAVNWPQLPERLPSHFGLDGRPDAYSGKSSLLLLPGIAVSVYILLTVVGRYPHRFNYAWKITPENAYRQYQLGVTMLAAVKAEVIWIFDYITLRVIRVSLGMADGLGPMFLPIPLVVVFGSIGLYFYVSYRER